jgi:hypothetical protein
MVPTHLPGAPWLLWLKNQPLRIGVLTGIYLTAVMTVALFTANRVPWLDGYADLRNWACRIVFLLIALIPVGTFLRVPWNLFSSGASAWLLFTLNYAVAGRYFENLHTRLSITSFHMFLLGAGIYAVVAVAIWVAGTARLAVEHLLAHEPAVRRAARPNE